MCNWKKWIWPGILAVAILTALSTWFRADVVEGDLTAKATSDLAAEHPWASVELDGRDLTLKGVSPSDEATASALQIADDAYDVRVVADGTDLLALADPFKLGAEKVEGKITLNGNVPNDEVRTTLVEAAKSAAEGSEVVDNMTLARGAPDGLAELGEFSIAQLSGLTTGKVDLTNSDLSISGVASGLEEFEAVNAALDAGLPASGNLVSRDITPPTITPYDWMADYDGNKVVLSGFAPNSDAKNAIENSIKAQLPKAEIENQMRLAIGAPSEFKSATDYAAGFFPMLSQGRVSYEDAAFSVSGVALSSSDFENATSRVGELPSGYTLAENSIQPVGASPYTWSAKQDGETVTLDGFAPSTDARQRINDAAKAAFPNAAVVDNLQIAGGATGEFDSAVDYSLNTLKRFTNGAAIMSDNTLNIRGVTDNQNEYKAALADIETGVEGIAVTGSITAPAATPYRWSVTRNSNGVVVRGNAPSSNEAASAVSQVSSVFGGTSVTDKQTIASGEPEGLSAARELLAGYVNRLEAGQGNLVDNAISVTGRASSEGVAKFIDTDLKAKAPAGYKVSSNILWPVEVSAPPEPPVADPYRWSVSKLPTAVTVLGNVADEAVGLGNIELVKSKLGAADVVDKQVVARGTPDGFADARSLVVSQVRYLEAGQGNIVGNRISVTGRAKNENIRNLIDRILKAKAPEGYETSTNITFPQAEVVKGTDIEFKQPEPEVTAEACQAGIIAAVDNRKIQFETARAVILPESEAVLKAVLDAAAKCPDLKMMIAGHTDSRGRDAYNQELSEARAKSVVDYLTAAGMAADRLEAKGFGETSPIETNDTPEGRAKNRRIEFNVVK